MLKYTLVGAALVLITVIIHAAGTTRWLGVVGRRYANVRMMCSIRIMP